MIFESLVSRALEPCQACKASHTTICLKIQYTFKSKLQTEKRISKSSLGELQDLQILE